MYICPLPLESPFHLPDPQLSCLQCISSFLSSLRSLSFVLWVTGCHWKVLRSSLLGFSFSQGCSKGVVSKLVELDSSWRTPALLDPWAPHPPTSPCYSADPHVGSPVLSFPLLEGQALTRSSFSLRCPAWNLAHFWCSFHVHIHLKKNVNGTVAEVQERENQGLDELEPWQWEDGWRESRVVGRPSSRSVASYFSLFSHLLSEGFIAYSWRYCGDETRVWSGSSVPVWRLAAGCLPFQGDQSVDYWELRKKGKFNLKEVKFSFLLSVSLSVSKRAVAVLEGHANEIHVLFAHKPLNSLASYFLKDDRFILKSILKNSKYSMNE